MRAGPELLEKSLKALQAAVDKSRRRFVRGSALRALATLDDPRSYETVFDVAQPGRDGDLRNQGITILGRLGRRDPLRDRTRATLTAWLYDPDRSAQAAAASGLGSLGDPRSLADLERIQNSSRDEGLRGAARGAIQALNNPPDPKQATAALIQRLAAIEKHNQELEKKVKDLSDQLEALKKPAKKEPGKAKGEKAPTPEGRRTTEIPFKHVVVDDDGPTDIQGKAIGDINGDGLSDLVVASTKGSIVWYENPKWTKHVISAGQGGWSCGMKVGDINGDGYQDIVVSDWFGAKRVVWFENPGKGVGKWKLHVIGEPEAHDIEVPLLARRMRVWQSGGEVGRASSGT